MKRFWLGCMGYLLGCMVPLLCNIQDAESAGRKITAVSVSTRGDAGITDKDDYLFALKDAVERAILEFLQEQSQLQKLTFEELESELGTIVFDHEGNCLSSPTLVAIFQALRHGCVPKNDDLISALMLSQLRIEKIKGTGTIRTSFFPYSLKRFKLATSPWDNSIDYEEKYPSIDRDRSITENLIILGFLNLYWEQVKDKPQLTQAQYAIIFYGFGTFSRKLSALCTGIPSPAKRRCQDISAEAVQITLQARGKVQ